MLHKEIVLSGSKSDTIQYCLKRLESMNAVISLHEGKLYTQISVAVDNANYGELINLITYLLIIDKKFEYLINNIAIKEYDQCLCALVSSLVYFDSVQEASRVNRIISGRDKYIIDGLYNFKLQELIEGWRELVDLTNSLLASGYNEVDIFNVINFMMSPRIKPDKSIFIADIKSLLITNVSKGGVIDVPDLYHNDEYNLINAIIAECPTEVIIEGESMDKSILKTLKNIVKIKII